MATTPTETVHHPIFARFYNWVSPKMERGGFGERRDQMLDGLSGRVVEVGAGNGMNFAHYPPEVTQVLAVEPEAYLRRVAEDNAARAPVPVEVVDGTAARLPAGDVDFDAAVASLVLCTVPDPDGALAEIRRVLRPGGELRFFEHVRADTPGLARVQRVLDATVQPRLAGGCHAGRDTAAAIERAGFTVERLDRFRLPETRIASPTSPHILGVAVAPPGGGQDRQ